MSDDGLRGLAERAAYSLCEHVDDHEGDVNTFDPTCMSCACAFGVILTFHEREAEQIARRERKELERLLVALEKLIHALTETEKP
jgi:hypothetical protein